MRERERDRGLLLELAGDGRPLLALTAIMLLLSGAFALFLSFRREFLPHDVAFLGMTADELCATADCRIVRFMFHDRVAFGGALIAVATLYLWLNAFPLRKGLAWAWWTFVCSGVLGFGSFLTYLGYGYLDSWHGTATLVLLPLFIAGLVLSKAHASGCATPWLLDAEARSAPGRLRLGRFGLLATGVSITFAGLVILYLGTTEVFVTEDLAFMGLRRHDLEAMSGRLIPLIAHDRAGFGGGLATVGILLTLCAWFAPPQRSFHEAVILAGAAGFGCAIGTHYLEGYLNTYHLAPAFAGAGLFVASVACEILGWRQMQRGDR